MSQSQLETTAGLTIDRAAARLEMDDVAPIARAAFEYAGEPVTREYGRPAAILGAIQLAARRADIGGPDRERLAAAFDVDSDRVVAADESLATQLSPPADADEIRSLRRRLIVAQEILAALERDRNAVPELPGSHLADAAPSLLARANSHLDSHTDCEYPGLDATALRDHIERLEADLELARLGTELYVLAHAEA